MMKKNKSTLFLILVLLMFLISYQSIIFASQSNEEIETHIVYNTDNKTIDYINTNQYELIKDFQDSTLLEYIVNLSGLEKNECMYLIEQCTEKEIDIFIVLGLIKYESNFLTTAVGSKGERGLGQLMANTAEPVAKNLGYDYNPDDLFNPKFNIEIFMTQLKYLYEFYERDIHKTLTSYNRGQYGLEKYIASRQSTHRDPAMSDYSVKVLDYALIYQEEFANY